MWNPVAALGGRAIDRAQEFYRDALGLGEIVSRTLVATAQATSGARSAARRTTVMQIYFTGVQSFTVAGFLALLIGYGFGQIVTTSGLFLMVPILRDLLVEQLGPLLAALVVIARSAPAVAVELANMKVAGELKMLEGFGVDPFRHLALPRILGITLGITALCFIVTAIALLALFVVVRQHPHFGGVDFWLAVRPEQALRVGLLGAAFGMAVALSAIHQGVSLIPVHTEVPKAASRAVIKSLVLCSLLAVVVTALARIA
jgi:phospholipid/cholesterol/gamma-HCH transport system permease protein